MLDTMCLNILYGEVCVGYVHKPWAFLWPKTALSDLFHSYPEFTELIFVCWVPVTPQDITHIHTINRPT